MRRFLSLSLSLRRQPERQWSARRGISSRSPARKDCVLPTVRTRYVSSARERPVKLLRGNGLRGNRRRGVAHRKRLPLCTIGRSSPRNFSRCAVEGVPSSLRPQLLEGKLSSLKAPSAACWAACDSSGGTCTAPRAGAPPKRH